MNSFSALSLDSDDEEPKVNKKTTTTTKATAGASTKKTPVVQRNIPGMPKARTSAPAAAAPAAPEYVAEDPNSTKVNDRGGKNSEKYNRHSERKGATPNDHKAHRGRHDYDRTGRGGGKQGSRGGRGPGGWGSVDEEARRAEKNVAEVIDGEVVASAEEDVVEEVEPVPTVFGFEEALERRNAARADNALFAAVNERKVEEPGLKVVKKEANPEELAAAKAAAKSKTQRSTTKGLVEANFTFAAGISDAPAPREPRSDAPRGGRGGRGGRGSDRDAGRGGRGARSSESRGPAPKLAAEDFPAL